MVGIHLPGDLYFPNNRNGGWIEEEPEEQVEADTPTTEEDPEEGQDDDEDIEKDLIEEDSNVDSKVSNPRFVVRNLHDHMPELRFQVYRHLGGPLWICTPRKRMPPFHRLDIFLTGVPLQGSTPRWAEDLHKWSHEHGQHSPYGM